MIEPHGGKLVNRTSYKKKKVLEQSNEFPKIIANKDIILEIVNIANGSFSPLEGFLTSEDFHSVLKKKKLANGVVWTVPMIFPVSKNESKNIKEGEDVAIFNSSNKLIAILHLEEKYHYNKDEAIKYIFGTKDKKHPGVRKYYSFGDILLGGKINLVQEPKPIVPGFELKPNETREIFRKKGWKTIVGFQTRNVPHRAHEHLQKSALELVDGLFIHPLIGWKKKGDFFPEIIMKCYKVLIENYFPKDRVVLGALTTLMRYAGPREAVFHAIIRKNYGCTHFIVGRDHAGVADYYEKYAAHQIFDEIEDIGIEILKLKGPYYCKKCLEVATEKTCPHHSKHRIQISGTKIRKMVLEGKKIPIELMRLEVSKLLLKKHLQ